MKMNWPIAWNATHNLIICMGVIAHFSFIVTLKLFLRSEEFWRDVEQLQTHRRGKKWWQL
jgi:hypothetical protein